MMLDFEMLRFAWWLIIGVLCIGFAVTDGFDLGAQTLFPWITRNDLEKRIILNAIGPFWEGNQVWIILAAGAVFAAFPFVYAVFFSGVYFPILILLLTMGISRPVSFKYRSKLKSYYWRQTWDTLVFIGGVVPAFLLGLLMGNLLIGLPFHFDETLRLSYEGHLSQLFTPFTLLAGLTSLTMLMMHGGLYLAIKSNGALEKRAVVAARINAFLFMIFFGAAGYYCYHFVPGYKILNIVDHYGYSNPLHKNVIIEKGVWFNNYWHYPILMTVPILAFIAGSIVMCFAKINQKIAFISSGLALSCVIATLGISLFPFILPSSLYPNHSLLVWDSSSSRLTLLVMLFVTAIFLPIILFYTNWVYRALRGKVDEKLIVAGDHTAY